MPSLPSSMRAVVLDAVPAPPEALVVRERPVPRPGQGWVLVEVKAFGLNRSELKTRLGLADPDVTLPRVLGIEATGLAVGQQRLTGARAARRSGSGSQVRARPETAWSKFRHATVWMERLYSCGMERKSFAGLHCSVAQCLEVVGDWWTLLIVRDAFFGVRRFDEFQERLGISRNVLNQRLIRLVEQDVLTKVPYSQRPPRYEYRLTVKGRDLWPILNAMRQWGDKHAAPDGPPLKLVHKTCGHVTEAVLTCSRCGEPISAGDVRSVPGSGDLDGIVASAGASSS